MRIWLLFMAGVVIGSMLDEGHLVMVLAIIVTLVYLCMRGLWSMAI